MGKTSYNDVGCAFGRELRELVEKQARICVENTTRTKERFAYGDRRFEELSDKLEDLENEVLNLQRRLYWLLGAFAVGGNLVGNLLFSLFQQLME